MTGPGGHLGDVVSALVDGQLAPAEEAGARAHLAACPACAADVETTAVLRALVRGLGPVHPLRPLLAVAPAPRLPTRAAGMVAAAAAAVALLVLSGVQPHEQGGPQVAQLVQVHSTSPVNLDPMSQLAPAVLPVSLDR